MSDPKSVRADERTVSVLYVANTWGANVIAFGLLLDILYRSAVLHEAPWDLFALLGISGVISMAYLARHKVLWQVFNWRSLIIMAIGAFVAALIGAITAMTKFM